MSYVVVLAMIDIRLQLSKLRFQIFVQASKKERATERRKIYAYKQQYAPSQQYQDMNKVVNSKQ